MEVWINLLRGMTAGEKIAAVFALNRMTFQLSQTGVKLSYPEADDREVFLRTAARYLNRDLMKRVYGWDPDSNEDTGGRV